MNITRSSVMNGAVTELGILPTPSPDEMKKDISLVYPVNLKYTEIVKEITITTTTTTTIYTTPPGKDFYLTYLGISVVKDVANDNVVTSINLTIANKLTAFMNIQFTTLTVDSKFVFITFPYPVHIDRGTAIQLAGAFTVGTMSKKGVVGGFILE